MGQTTEQTAVKFPGDERPERFVHNGSNPVGPLALSAINRTLWTSLAQINARPTLDETAEVLGAMRAVQELMPYEKAKLDAQIDPERPYTTTYLSPEVTAALVTALVKCEAYLHLYADGGEAHKQIQRALRATGRRLVTRGNGRGWLPYDIFFVLDDDIGDYELDKIGVKGAEKYIGGIEAVWFFDRNEHTHLCEATPSYCLNFFEVRAFVKDEYEDDKEAERVRDQVADALRAPDVYDDVSYRHVHDVDRFLERNAGIRGKVYHWGNPGLDLDAVRDEVLDNLGRGVNEARRRKGEPPLSAEQIEREWAEGLDEQIGMSVMEKVREAVQGNPVL